MERSTVPSGFRGSGRLPLLQSSPRTEIDEDGSNDEATNDRNEKIPETRNLIDRR